MRSLLIAAVSILGLAAMPVAASADCPPLAGVKALWAKPTTRFVIFGEFHGTVETPALVADVVCHAVATGRPVRVGLEYEEVEQAPLERFMTSEQARYESGAPGLNDGRRSQAMMEMLRRIRALRSAGADVQLFAFLRPSAPGRNQTPHEHAMATAWIDQAVAHPEALIVALVGNIHALKGSKVMQNGVVRQLPFTPATTFLPQEAALSVRSILPGGEAWGCRAPPQGCKGYSLPMTGAQPPRGIHLRPELGMDGRFSVGRPFTASPPAFESPP